MAENAEAPATKESSLPGAILPLFAVARDATWYPLGTCFVVAITGAGEAAFALTARHNLTTAVDLLRLRRHRSHSSALREFVPEQQQFSLGDRLGEIYAVVPEAVPAGTQLTHGPQSPANLTHAWLSQAGDVALIRLQTVEPSRFHVTLKLNSYPLYVGEAIAAFGNIPHIFAQTQNHDEQQFTATAGMKWQRRDGVVTQQCLNGYSIHKWAGYLGSTPFDSGMSGGPVLDAQMRVRGLVGGDMSLNPDDGAAGSGAGSFIVDLTAMYFVRPDVSVEGPDKSGTEITVQPGESLLEWVRHGFIDDSAEPHINLSISEDADGAELFWRQRPRQRP